MQRCCIITNHVVHPPSDQILFDVVLQPLMWLKNLLSPLMWWNVNFATYDSSNISIPGMYVTQHTVYSRRV